MWQDPINSLRENSILYTILADDLLNFKEVALTHHDKITSFIPPQFQQINIFITIGNIWFTLHSFKKPYFLDETRRMNYSAAFIQLEFVGRNTTVKQFIHTQKLDEAGSFYLAFFISLECMTWVTTIMERAQQEDIIAYYMQDENFLHLESDETSDGFKQMLDFQKVYVKEMIKNLQHTTELTDALKVAMNKTRQLLKTEAVR